VVEGGLEDGGLGSLRDDSVEREVGARDGQ
jgi:hypothetical protein